MLRCFRYVHNNEIWQVNSFMKKTVLWLILVLDLGLGLVIVLMLVLVLFWI